MQGKEIQINCKMDDCMIIIAAEGQIYNSDCKKQTARQHKTRQEKTRQDKTREAKTRQDKRRQ